ncbi:hypothetical protein ACFQH2_10925 [Natronoarchaeum sp. GCM10025703]|uniref:hypothetical protein n=2 Tax=unclassified Natronoarchaeum TaxID=2620183 RepID=UPI00360C995A
MSVAPVLSCMGTEDVLPDLDHRLARTVERVLDDAVDWTLDDVDDGYRLVAPDRTLLITRRAGPKESVRWVISLRADGATVSKFGPFASVDDVADQVKTVLDADVQYTVCCDG